MYGGGGWDTGAGAGILEGQGMCTSPPIPTHHNTYSWQADGTHPTGMFSCSACDFLKK